MRGDISVTMTATGLNIVGDCGKFDDMYLETL